MDQTGTPPPEPLPKWLSEEYFRSLFRRKSPGEEVTVQNVSVNFADEERAHGRLIRAVVDVATPSGPRTHSYIVKCPGPGEFSTTPASVNQFRMEALILGEVIPAMEKVLDAVAPGKYGQLAPRLVDHSIDGNRFIMTEDLTVQGFSPGCRQQGLDLDHCLAYAKHLAAFHAASAAVLERYEPEIAAIPLLIDSEEVKYLNDSIAASTQGVASALGASEGGARVRQLGASLPARLAQANRARHGPLSVVCHGDMFVNNVLFRREEEGGRAAAVRLVDFELSRVGSFADDLLGFAVSCTADEVLVGGDRWALVEEAYRAELNAALLALGLGARALSPDALREELRAQRAVAQFAAFHVLPRSRAPVAEEDPFEAPAYRALLRQLLPRFLALGWLDESEQTEYIEKSWVGLEKPGFQFCLQLVSIVQAILLYRSTAERTTAERTTTERTTTERTTTETTTTETTTTETTTTERTTTTADIPGAGNDTVSPSGGEAESLRVKCPGYGDFCTTRFTTSLLEMEPLVRGKVLPAAAEILEEAAPGKIGSTAPRSLNQNRSNSCITTAELTNDRRPDGFRPTSRQKTSDLKFCLAIVRHLALFHAASMIASESNIHGILDVPTVHISTIWRNLQACINTSMRRGRSQSPTRDKEARNTEERSATDLRLSKETLKTEKLQAIETRLNTEKSQATETRLTTGPPEKQTAKTRPTSKFLNPEKLLAQSSKQQAKRFRIVSNKTIRVNKSLSQATETDSSEDRLLDFQREGIDSRVNGISGFVFNSATDDTPQANFEVTQEDYYTTLNVTLGILSSRNQEIFLEDLRNKLDFRIVVTQFALNHMLSRAANPETVRIRSENKSTSARVFGPPGYCRQTERFLPWFDTWNFVYV